LENNLGDELFFFASPKNLTNSSNIATQSSFIVFVQYHKVSNNELLIYFVSPKEENEEKK